MPTPETPLPTGRARIVAIVLLVLVIGAAGAIVGPRLLHETKGPPLPTGVGQVCLEVLTESGFTRSGEIRVTARSPDRPDLDIREPIPENASAEAVEQLLMDSATDADWGPAQGVQLAGHCLALGRVTEIGGDPGSTGTGLSLGLAAEGQSSIAVRIRLEGLEAPPADSLPILALHLYGRGAWRSEGPTPTARVDFTAALSATETLATVREQLKTQGWGFEAKSDGTLVVRAVPGEEPLSSLMLSVSYPTDPGAGPPPETLRWTLSVVR